MRKARSILACVAVLAAIGCGGANSVNSQNGVYVGSTTDSAEDVVLVFDAPSGGNSRGFHAYLTDGSSISEFYSGTANGNIFDVTNTDGDINGTVDSFGAQGVVNFSSNTASFDASPSPSLAGLYTVTVDMSGGTVTGSSTNGDSLTGTIGTTPIGSDFQVSGTITPSGGTATAFSALITDDSDGQQRWIVSPTLIIRGGPIASQGTGFVTSES